MAITITNEGTSTILTVACTDELKAATTPTSATWTLKNQGGEIVNLREDVVMTPSTSMTIVLLAADLSMADGNVRFVRVSAVYDSVNGSGLTIEEQAQISITDLV